MNARLLKLLKPPRDLPPPDPRCRCMDRAATIVLLRNHERQFEQSRNLHAPVDTHTNHESGGRVVPFKVQ